MRDYPGISTAYCKSSQPNLDVSGSKRHNCLCGLHSAFAPDLAEGEDQASGDQAGEIGRDEIRFQQPEDPFVQIATGENFICARSRSGDIACWGQNDFGQLGRADALASVTFAQRRQVNLGAFGTPAELFAGGQTVCALNDSGALKCWGRNDRGQLGQRQRGHVGASPESLGDNLPIVDLGTNRTARSVSVGTNFVCAVLDDASKCCVSTTGPAGQGQDWFSYGTGRTHMGDNLQPIDILDGEPAAFVSAGDAHVCVVTVAGVPVCWGANQRGQLGMEDILDRGRDAAEMAELTGISMPRTLGVKQIAAGQAHTCALLFDKSVICWVTTRTANSPEMKRREATPDAPSIRLRPLTLDVTAGHVLLTNLHAQSAAHPCRAGTCREPGCFDGIQNARETDRRGGGDCALPNWFHVSNTQIV